MFWSWTATRAPLPSFEQKSSKRQPFHRFFQKTTAKSRVTRLWTLFFLKKIPLPKTQFVQPPRLLTFFAEWSNGALRRLFAYAYRFVEHSTNLRLLSVLPWSCCNLGLPSVRHTRCPLFLRFESYHARAPNLYVALRWLVVSVTLLLDRSIMPNKIFFRSGEINPFIQVRVEPQTASTNVVSVKY